MKKCRHGLLQALSSDRWDVLLCIIRIMLLVLYSVFFHLGWLQSSLNFGVLKPLFVLLFFYCYSAIDPSATSKIGLTARP